MISIISIKGPEVVIDQPDLNFGLMRVDDSAISEVVLRNTSQVTADWTVAESEAHCRKVFIV